MDNLFLLNLLLIHLWERSKKKRMFVAKKRVISTLSILYSFRDLETSHVNNCEEGTVVEIRENIRLLVSSCLCAPCTYCTAKIQFINAEVILFIEEGPQYQ